MFSTRTPDQFPAVSTVHGAFQGSATGQIDERNSYVNEEAIENLYLDNNGKNGNKAHTYCILGPGAMESHSYDMLYVA
jgi:hypothetical protein